MKLLQKTLIGSSIVLAGMSGFCAKKPPVDLGTLPPIPGTPMSETDFKEVVDSIVAAIPQEFAVFDKQPLLLKDIEAQIRTLLKNPRTRKAGKARMQKLVESVCKSALEKKALMKMAMDHPSYKPVTDEDFKKEFDQLVQRYQGEDKLREGLKKDGITFERFQQIVKDNLVIKRYFQAFRSEIKISDEDIEVEYNNRRASFKTPEQVKASHILKRIPKDADDTIKSHLKKELKGLLDQLKQGADFAELAKKESDCPSGKRGGSLGFFDKGKMVKPFSDAAFKLQPGEISDIIETRFGYHIIKLEEKKSGQDKKLADVKPVLVRDLQYRKMNTQLKEAVNKCITQYGGKLLLNNK